ncbi:MAG: YeeE/YedE family protein [Myxococcales bacterium]|nr:YeeE/YedE family protein [Myxococcales bacterium]
MSLRHELWTSALAGFLFATGLGLSGMTNAHRILGFLRVGENWDPTMAMVIVGAVGVFAPIYQIYRRRHHRPVFGNANHVPSSTDINGKLILGAALFGLGWGLVGLCPGPAWVSLVSLHPSAILFVIAMFGGMGLYGWFISISKPNSSS